MKLNEKDKNNLIILAVFIGILALVAFFYTSTRYLPLIYIAIIMGIAMFILFGVIAHKYLGIYKIEHNYTVFVPIWNCLLIFDRPVALLLVANIVISIILAIINFIPADIFGNIMGIQMAYAFCDRIVFVQVLNLVLMFIIIGFGFAIVYKDVRRMLYDITGIARPKLEWVNYPLLFIPLFNVLGLSSIVSAIGLVQRYGYHEGDVNEEEELNEV